MVCVGETVRSSGAPPTDGGSSTSPSLAPWISPELLSMFQFHHMKALPVQQEKQIIHGKVGKLYLNVLHVIIH